MAATVAKGAHRLGELASPAAVAIGASLLAGSVVVASGRLTLLLTSAVVVLVMAARFPAVVWAGALAASVLAYETVWTAVAFTHHNLSIKVSDAIPILIAAATLGGGLRRGPSPRAVHVATGAGAAFALLVGVGVYRSLGPAGLEGALQARHLLPLLAVPVLPLSRRLSSLSSRTIAHVIAAGLVALAVRCVVLAASGYEARNVPGVQRVFQTWEPFIAGGLGLALLAFVLAAPRPSLLHYAGLAASSVPLLLGFFRTAWVLVFVGAIGVVAVVRGARSVRLLLAVAVGTGVLALAAQLGVVPHTTVSEEAATRLGQITTELDTYRARELAAVWDEIRAHPLVGSGFGTEYSGSWTIYRAWSHNAYEWLWWRLGIFGVLSFAVLLGTAVVAGAGAARRATGDDRGLAVGLVAATLFTAAAANVHENFENYQTNLVVSLVLAQLLILATRHRKPA